MNKQYVREFLSGMGLDAKHSRIKFYSVLTLHALLFVGFFFISKVIPSLELSLKDLIFTALFSVVYFILVWLDLYSRPYHHYLKNAFYFIFRDLLLCSVVLFVLEYVFSIVTNPEEPFRVVIKDFALVLFYFVMHVIQYFWVIHLARLGFFSKNVMLVGSYDPRIPVEDLFQNINNTKHFVGQLLYYEDGWRYRANLEEEAVPLNKDFSHFLFSHHANELIICIDSHITPAALWECASWCIDNSIGYYLVPDISKLPHVYPWQGRFSVIPSVERYCPNRDSLIMISFKRALDIVASAFALIVLSPIMALTALLIKAEDGGPIFYVSKRIGVHGRTIRFYKFRSMVRDAEKKKKDLLALNERPDGPLFKLKNDPRVTRIGRIIRETSIDELPQFWNVIRGDMSLVGPRPHLPEEVAAYSDIDNLRLECIPGISCLPQIYGRDTLGFREWVDLDLEYRKKWSLGFDIKILLQTVQVVLDPNKR